MAGITRREQWALMGVIGLVLLGLAVQQWRRADSVSAALVDPASGTWQTLATLEVTPSPAAAPSTLAAIAAPAPSTSAPAAASPPLASPASPSGLIDLNRASASDLETLPGIGPAKSAAILATRTRLGAFSSVDQLDEVPGFGAKTLERLRPLLTVGAAPPAAASAVPTPAVDAVIVATPSPVAAPSLASVSEAPPPTSTPPAPAATENATGVASAPATRAVVNLNTASAEQLEQVNGIGPVLARRIIEYRTRRGPFRAISELDGVSGIGPKTLDKMRPQLTLE